MHVLGKKELNCGVEPDPVLIFFPHCLSWQDNAFLEVCVTAEWSKLRCTETQVFFIDHFSSSTCAFDYTACFFNESKMFLFPHGISWPFCIVKVLHIFKPQSTYLLLLKTRMFVILYF